MNYDNVLEGLAGNSPFIAFLIWYILSERKVRQSDKEYNRKKQDLRDDEMQKLLMENQKIILANTDIMKGLGERYEELKIIVTTGFAETNKDIKNLYRKVTNDDNQ